MKITICDFCKIQKPVTYTLFKLVLQTNCSVTQFGMSNLFEQMENWNMKTNMYHLSASQMVLLRPDLLLEFFKYFKSNETIVTWFMKAFVVCKDCMEVYKETVPARR